MTQISASEAARNFSDLLNRVADGEEIEIARNGASVAIIGPPRPRYLSAERFRDLLQSLPDVDDDFADDLRRVRGSVGLPEDPWQS